MSNKGRAKGLGKPLKPTRGFKASRMVRLIVAEKRGKVRLGR